MKSLFKQQYRLVSSTSEGTHLVNKHQSHLYPLVRSGGLFLILIGAGIIVDVALSGAFIVGTVFAVISLMFAKVLSLGKPTGIQIITLALAIILEIVLLIIMVNVMPAGIAVPVRLMWVLMIVGVHFLPMAICFGPRFAIVGILCVVNALAGLIIDGSSSLRFCASNSTTSATSLHANYRMMLISYSSREVSIILVSCSSG